MPQKSFNIWIFNVSRAKAIITKPQNLLFGDKADASKSSISLTTSINKCSK